MRSSSKRGRRSGRLQHQIFGLWNGFQTNGGANVIQPILQFGQFVDYSGNTCGFDNQYSINTFYAWTGGGYCSPSQPVQPGDVIDLNIREVDLRNNGSCAPLSMLIDATDTTTGAWTAMFAPFNNYGWVMTQSAVLEAPTENVTLCDQFPPDGSIHFSVPTLYQSIPNGLCNSTQITTSLWQTFTNWLGKPGKPQCPYAVSVGPLGDPILYY